MAIAPVMDIQATETVEAQMHGMGVAARAAARQLARASTGVKNAALVAVAERLVAERDTLLAANALDVERARAAGTAEALVDRLMLSPDRIAAMAQGLRDIAILPDPVGAIDELSYRPSGIQVGRMRVPLGVIGIVYESRPNVTADAAGLCLKAGNACILRGGSDAIDSNRAIARCVQDGLQQAGLPAAVVQLVQTTDRAAVGALIRMHEFVDVIVPRGGKSLIERVAREATVPVIKHLDGICHVYIDDRADPAKALAVAVNSKTQRYGTCNTLETLLVARAVAADMLPALAERYREAGVQMRGCEITCAIIDDAVPASAADWDTEYLAPVLAIRVVDGLDEAMDHIERHGSRHTDAIVTEDWQRARRFLAEVDSSSVMVNASTRFADGFEYGLGAEIGISTDKLHARGPVGLEGLTTRKYIVLGDGHVRE